LENPGIDVFLSTPTTAGQRSFQANLCCQRSIAGSQNPGSQSRFVFDGCEARANTGQDHHRLIPCPDGSGELPIANTHANRSKDTNSNKINVFPATCFSIASANLTVEIKQIFPEFYSYFWATIWFY
jgi:hypothetical protein